MFHTLRKYETGPDSFNTIPISNGFQIIFIATHFMEKIQLLFRFLCLHVSLRKLFVLLCLNTFLLNEANFSVSSR